MIKSGITETSRRLKPVIFVQDEGHDSLAEVLLDEHTNFDIYWFHWPHDSLLPEEDYEPVVIIYNGLKICCVITRRAWTYQTYMMKDGLEIPPEILFDTSFHHPFAKAESNREDFERKKRRLVHREYKPRKINAAQIPMKFRTGVGHLSNIRNFWLGEGLDPSIYAGQVYNQFCK